MNIIEVDWHWNNKLSNRSRTDYIVLHLAEASRCTVQQIDEWHKANGWSGIGYHFFVRKDGSIDRGRPIDKLGAHVQGMNGCSIGICAEGAYSREFMPVVQKRAIAELIDYLKSNFYPNARVVGHKEIGSSDCPGKNYPLRELKDYKSILNNESENLTMSQYMELKNMIVDLNTKVDKLSNEKMVYNYIDQNMPESYRPTIQKLVGNGVLRGNEQGELMLTKEMMRILTILDRIGILG